MRPLESSSWIAQASGVLGVLLTHHIAGQAKGPCPKCGGEDRFVVFVEGNAWCRQCRHKGWWRRPNGEVRKNLEEEQSRRGEMQLAVRASMMHCQDWQTYHDLCLSDPLYLRLWESDGMDIDQVRKWGLGYCASCPLAPTRPSLTIPVFYREQLVDIRHRLVNASPGDKYRSHVHGLLPHPFNLDALDAALNIVVVEGEKKTISMVGAGYLATVGLPGINIREELVNAMDRAHPEQRITVMLDPGANGAAREIAAALIPCGIPVYLADAWAKPDDLLKQHGRRVIDILLQQSRRMLPNNRSTWS